MNKYVMYSLIVLGIIILIILIVLFIYTHKLTKKIKILNTKTNAINDHLNESKDKLNYIKRVKDKSFLDEALLGLVLFKDIRKNMKHSNIVSSSVKAIVKDIKPKEIKAIPNKLRQFQ